MALVIYPTTDYDSFVSIADANTIIEEYSLHNDLWSALSDAEKEVYLRVGTDRIFSVISTDDTDEAYLDSTVYDATTSCLPKSNALMAIHDVVYGLSTSINPNKGLITKEKVGDLEVNYFQGYSKNPKSGIVTNPFPNIVKSCLETYGATFNLSGLTKASVENS